MKTLLSGNLSRVARLGMRQFRRHEWLLVYKVVRPVALQASNLAGGFRWSGLIPYAPRAVSRRLPPDPLPRSLHSTRRQQAPYRCMSPQLLRNASPTGQFRQVVNAAVRRMLLSEKGLKRSAKKCLRKVVDCVELLQTQLTIAQK
jgi:hypothetical protein